MEYFGATIVTSSVLPTAQIDKITLSLRFGEGNFFPTSVIRDTLAFYLENGLAARLPSRRYGNSQSRAIRFAIKLGGRFRSKLIVEIGNGVDPKNPVRIFPYATFEFNLYELEHSTEARERIIQALNDLIPEGGLPVLFEDAKVAYVEFAIDFINVRIDEVCAFHPSTDKPPHQALDKKKHNSIYLFSHTSTCADFCIYDKKAEQRSHWIRRYDRLRIEARLRLNKIPALRNTSFKELSQIPNPFSRLMIIDKDALPIAFNSQRHVNWLSIVHTKGLQMALRNGASVDRERRIRMLSQAKVNWWDTEKVWRLVQENIASYAIQQI